MRLLVIGYGSIGARHSRIASSLGIEVASVTRNQACPYQRFSELEVALDQFAPDRIIIANPTGQHAGTLRALAQARFAGGVLIEKPLFAFGETVDKGQMRVYVAYNLRFHPLVQALRNTLGDLPLFSASFCAGQYLPQWRPETDYRHTYSASRSMGGGVLRDLSHEIDLSLWFCGRVHALAALGGHFSDLEIQSDDVFSTLSAHERCPAVSVAVNYLDRVPRRIIAINARDLSAVLDLVNGSLMVNGKTEQIRIERDVTYRAQLEAFASDDASTLCTLEEGLDVVRFIDAAESAASRGAWPHP